MWKRDQATTNTSLAQSRGPFWRRRCQAGRPQQLQLPTRASGALPTHSVPPGASHDRYCRDNGAWTAARAGPSPGPGRGPAPSFRGTAGETQRPSAARAPQPLTSHVTTCPVQGPRAVIGTAGKPDPGGIYAACRRRDPPPLTPAHRTNGWPRCSGKFPPKFCHISHKQAFTLKSQSRCPL